MSGETRASGWRMPLSSRSKCSTFRAHFSPCWMSGVAPPRVGSSTATASKPLKTPAAARVDNRIRWSRPDSVPSGTAQRASRRGHEAPSTTSPNRRFHASAMAKPTTGSSSMVSETTRRSACPSNTGNTPRTPRNNNPNRAPRLHDCNPISDSLTARNRAAPPAAICAKCASKCSARHPERVTPPCAGKSMESGQVRSAISMSTYSRMTSFHHASGWAQPHHCMASAPPSKAGITSDASCRMAVSCHGFGDLGRTERTTR